jgi:hypothetical protein
VYDVGMGKQRTTVDTAKPLRLGIAFRRRALLVGTLPPYSENDERQAEIAAVLRTMGDVRFGAMTPAAARHSADALSVLSLWKVESELPNAGLSGRDVSRWSRLNLVLDAAVFHVRALAEGRMPDLRAAEVLSEAAESRAAGINYTWKPARWFETAELSADQLRMATRPDRRGIIQKRTVGKRNVEYAVETVIEYFAGDELRANTLRAKLASERTSGRFANTPNK